MSIIANTHIVDKKTLKSAGDYENLTVGKEYGITATYKKGDKLFYVVEDDSGCSVWLPAYLFDDHDDHLQPKSLSEGIEDHSKAKQAKKEKARLAERFPHYYIDVSLHDHLNVYDVLKMFNVTDPALQHAIKKLLALGNRGHKDHDRDLRDVKDSLLAYELSYIISKH